jgi:phage terminase large subunit-like protein
VPSATSVKLWTPRTIAEARAADDAVEFVQSLRHTRGRWSGTRFNLRLWQEHEIIRPAFGILNEDGKRRIRTVYLEVPRKNGKSELAAAIALKLLTADGEPGAEIYGAASDKEQAGIIYRIAAAMVRNHPQLRARCKCIDYSKTIYVTRGISEGSFYKAVPADPDGSWGYHAHGVIFDELHVQPNRELWESLTTSTAARDQPLVVGVTTAGWDRTSLCWDLHEYSREVIEGIIEDPTWLAVIYGAAEGADWTSPETHRLANPNYGVTVMPSYFEGEVRKAQQQLKYQSKFRRVHLNMWTSAETQGIDMAHWQECSTPIVQHELVGRECYGGLDLASTSDLAAFLLCFPPDDPKTGIYRFLCRFWLPGENIRERGLRHRAPYENWVQRGFIEPTPGDAIDYETIRRDIEAMSEFFNIQEIAYDRWGATQMQQQLTNAGFTMYEVGQGFASYGPPTREFLRLVTQHRIAHGRNPVLRWMADNVVLDEDAAGNMKPNKRKSRTKIDGIPAAIMALDRATRHTGGKVGSLGAA